MSVQGYTNAQNIMYSVSYFQARYSMGIKAVSSLQYNVEDMGGALVHIDTETDGDSTTFHMAAG